MRSLLPRILSGIATAVLAMTAVLVIAPGGPLGVLLAAGAALLAGLTVTLVSMGPASESVRRMSDVVERVREGDFTARVPPDPVSELDRLASGINAMIARNRELIDRLSVSWEEQRAILSSLGEGVLVVSDSGTVSAANESFAGMACGGRDPVGSRVIRGVTSPGFRETILSALRGEPLPERLDAGERSFAVSMADVSGGGGKVFGFADVTGLTNLSRMKRELAESAAHELRTPLTAIRGYTETLLETASTEQADFLRIIERNTERLTRLAEDLRSLSELESTGMRLDIEELDAADVVSDVMELFSRRKPPGVELVFDRPETPMPVMADRFRMEQVLANLLENALMHTAEGTVTVALVGGGEEGLLEVSVTDTGRGIPAEHLERLFERFYVVDRARSRGRGGTGLGLAIVKHIMNMHGGRVTVWSAPGRGSTFTAAFRTPPGFNPGLTRG